MLTAYYFVNRRLEVLPEAALDQAEWIDLLRATPEEEAVRSFGQVSHSVSEDRLEALSVASDAAGRPMHLLKKYVWVVQAFNAAFVSAFGPHLTFKGGISLSKIAADVKSFDEPIDVCRLIESKLDARQPIDREWQWLQPRDSK